MTEPERENDSKDNGHKRAINAGTGVAIGSGVGAAMFAATDDPIWIAIGTGLGAAFGAMRGR